MTKKYDIIWAEVLDSTNEEVRRHISDLDNLSVLSVSRQTAGRGQRGNTWSSAPGENLTFSILLKFRTGEEDSSLLPPLAAADQFVLSEITSLSVIRLLENHGIKASVKWPNDIYAGFRKICGMLLENSLRGSYVSCSIIGIGLNVNQRNFDVTLPNPTSMIIESAKFNHLEKSCKNPEESSPQYDLKALLNEFMEIFVALIDKYMGDRKQSFEQLREDYLSHLWRLNEPARFTDYTVLPSGHTDRPVVAGINNDSGREFTGTIRGLSPIGHLVVEDHDTAALREFSFKGIGYIL